MAYLVQISHKPCASVCHKNLAQAPYVDGDASSYGFCTRLCYRNLVQAQCYLGKGSTIEEIIQAAKKKFNLTAEKYKIFMEDGTEIDEDEYLIDLAKNTTDYRLLVIVPDDMSWSDDFVNKTTTVTATVASTSQSSLESPEARLVICPLMTNQINYSTHLTHLFPKFSQKIQNNLINKKPLCKIQRRAVVNIVSEYMINYLDDYTLGTATKISSEICDKYEEAFVYSFNGRIVSQGPNILKTAIYDSVNYHKKCTKKRNLANSTNDDETEEPAKKKRKHDQYGCVAFQPLLPEEVTEETQEEKRLKLLDIENQVTAADYQEICRLMQQTYYYQRKKINCSEKIIETFIDWPYLRDYRIFLAHASELLGKNVEEVWKTTIQTVTQPITRYFKTAEILKEFSKRRAKKSGVAETGVPEKAPKIAPGKTPEIAPETAPGKTPEIAPGKVPKIAPGKAPAKESITYIRDAIKEAKNHAKLVKNDTPLTDIIFSFIVRYMKEEQGHLYRFVNEELSDDQICKEAPLPTPVLIIRGKNLQDVTNKYDVIVENRKSISTESFQGGILVTFLLYYVFALKYPKSIQGTLETIQRLFLEICPEEGTKRASKTKKATAIHPKVLSLTENIEVYTNPLNDSN